MTSITSLQEIASRRFLAEAKRQQHEMGMSDGLSDFQISCGAWVDATSAGLEAQDVAACFWASTDALDFEARVWAAMKMKGINPHMPDLDALNCIMENGALPPANDNAPMHRED